MAKKILINTVNQCYIHFAGYINDDETLCRLSTNVDLILGQEKGILIEGKVDCPECIKILKYCNHISKKEIYIQNEIERINRLSIKELNEEVQSIISVQAHHAFKLINYSNFLKECMERLNRDSIDDDPVVMDQSFIQVMLLIRNDTILTINKYFKDYDNSIHQLMPLLECHLLHYDSYLVELRSLVNGIDSLFRKNLIKEIRNEGIAHNLSKAQLREFNWDELFEMCLMLKNFHHRVIGYVKGGEVGFPNKYLFKGVFKAFDSFYKVVELRKKYTQIGYVPIEEI